VLRIVQWTYFKVLWILGLFSSFIILYVLLFPCCM